MDTQVEEEVAQISRRVRSWREAAGLTLQELARRSGVATSTIQKVETEQMIPSVAVVLKIARGLGRRTAELVQGGDDQVEVVVTRARQRQSVGVSDRLTVERLTGDVTDPTIESWRVTLHPGVSSGREAIAYNGEELLICDSGVLTLWIGETEYALRAGDTAHFKASTPHRWHNAGAGVARFTVIGTLPRKLRALLHERVARESEG